MKRRAEAAQPSDAIADNLTGLQSDYGIVFAGMKAQ
jgi:hypothetical protein